jgi:hypothetical protein
MPPKILTIEGGWLKALVSNQAMAYLCQFPTGVPIAIYLMVCSQVERLRQAYSRARPSRWCVLHDTRRKRGLSQNPDFGLAERVHDLD